MNHSVWVDAWGGPSFRSPGMYQCDALRDGLDRMDSSHDERDSMLNLFRTTLGIVFVSRAAVTLIWLLISIKVYFPKVPFCVFSLILVIHSCRRTKMVNHG
jgi:hypothetical protein